MAFYLLNPKLGFQSTLIPSSSSSLSVSHSHYTPTATLSWLPTSAVACTYPITPSHSNVTTIIIRSSLQSHARISNTTTTKFSRFARNLYHVKRSLSTFFSINLQFAFNSCYCRSTLRYHG